MPTDAALPDDLGPSDEEVSAFLSERALRERAVEQALIKAGTRLIDLDDLWVIRSAQSSLVVGPFLSYEDARTSPEHHPWCSVVRLTPP